MTSNGSTCDSGEFDTEEEPFDQVEGELSTVRGPNGELRLVRSIQTQTNEDDFDCASPARASRGKRKIDGALSPSRKRRRAKGPTRLRKGKPVASRVPMDVWEMVLSHCPGKFLARARRIDRSFYQMLTYESAWRKNRLQNNGSDMPGPFPGMKEDHYANLLEGLGCMDCLTPKTRKTFWVWRQRWCFDCFGKNTIREDLAMKIVPDHPTLVIECAAFGVVDSWGRYDRAGVPDRQYERLGQGQHRVYGKADLAALVSEMEQFRSAGENGGAAEWDLEALNGWFATKRAARDELMKHSQAIENWIEKAIRDKRTGNTEVKAQRARFFQERAKALDPPLEPDALQLILAYKRSVDIPRPPSDRSWKALLPKIEKDRAAAQEAMDNKRRRAEKEDRERVEQMDYSRRLNRRRHQRTPEQQIVDRLADEVLFEMTAAAASVTTTPIADADFALLALREIRAKYYRQAADFSLKHDRPARYRLLLEDARWAFDKHIAPWMREWGTVRSEAASLFKCPGCTRGDTNLRYRFETLFCHVRRRHAAELGDYSFLFREGHNAEAAFRWLDFEWPPNLPALAEHHVATGRWDPNDERPYVRFVAAPTRSVVSAFERRVVSRDGPQTPNVVENIIHAAMLFRNTGLESIFKTGIVMRFAVDKCRAMLGDPSYVPPLGDIAQLPIALVRAGLYDIFGRSRCAVCLNHGGFATRETHRIYSAGTLIHHFTSRHGAKDWSKDMMEMPEPHQLWRVLNGVGMESALDVFKRLFPRIGGEIEIEHGDGDGDGAARRSASGSQPGTDQAGAPGAPGAPGTAPHSVPQVAQGPVATTHGRISAGGTFRGPGCVSFGGGRAAFNRLSGSDVSEGPVRHYIYQRKHEYGGKWQQDLDELFSELEGQLEQQQRQQQEEAERPQTEPNRTV